MIDNSIPNNRFRVVPLPQFARGGKWRTEAMRSYSQSMLIWFTKGQGRITVAGVTRGYGPHNAVFVPAGTMFGFDVLGQVFGSIVYFPMEADIDLPGEPCHLRFRLAAQHTELAVLIDNIDREAARDQAREDRAREDRGLLHHGGLLAVWLLRQIDALPDTDHDTDASRRLASAYTALVERDFHLGKGVNNYAAELGVTATHLSRACNIACGRPALAILRDRIHFEARCMLAQTRAPVKDIASHLGFNSAAYFTRAFQKHAGTTPTSFRKRQ
ncbi:MAG: helix-turn-helix domain-containing protein [Paracoccaceae bacterium]